MRDMKTYIHELNMIKKFVEIGFNVEVDRRDVQMVVVEFTNYYRRWWRKWSPKSKPWWAAKYIMKKHPDKDKETIINITIALQAYLVLADEKYSSK